MLLIHPRTTAPSTVGWALPHQPTIKKTTHELAQGQFAGEIFSGIFFPENSSLCQVAKNYLGEDPFPSSFSILFRVSLLATSDSPGADFPLTHFPQNGVSGTELLRVSSHRNQHSNAQLFSRPRQLGLQPESRPSLTPCTLGPAVLCSESPHSSWHHPGPQTTDATPHACDVPNLRAFRVYFLLS